MRVLVPLFCLSLAAVLLPVPARAEDLPPGVFNPHGNRPIVETKIESRPDGVYIQISVRQSVPGSQSAQQTANTQAPATSGGTSGVPVGAGGET